MNQLDKSPRGHSDEPVTIPAKRDLVGETKKCEKCNHDFDIQADDIAFYEKMDLPLPVLCPHCRFKYLLAFWVFGRFRITKSALSGKTIITVLPESVPFPIYERNEFVSDAWDPLTYGKDYDPSRPFIEQLVELQSKVPHPHQVGVKNTNSDWADDAWESKPGFQKIACLECYQREVV